MSEYLYVCQFSNGHIKVGRSIHPKSRIAQHADRVACLGIELIEHHIIECVGHSAPAENALIDRCTELCTKRNKSEWFEGVEYLAACELATTFASEDFEQNPVLLNGCDRFTNRDLQKDLSADEKQDICNFLGFGRGFLGQVLSGRKQASVKLCVAIEQRTGKKVTRQELRPDDWHLIWPELAEKTAA